MKKNILWLAAATLLLTACNNDENGTGNENAVRVEIGSSSPKVIVASRASIGNSDWARTQGVGLFGVAKDATDWTITAGDVYIINNLSVSIGTASDGHPIQFPSTVLYPTDNTYAYSFYGYYPRQSEESISRNESSITCDVTLTGAEDLIWGEASHSDPEAYNGRYIRNGNSHPAMAFEHLLTRFTFSIADGNLSNGASILRINAVRLIEVKNQATLIIADRTNAANAGTLIDTEGEATFTLRESNGNVLIARNIPSTETVIGESIMVIPGEPYYTVEIDLQTAANEIITREMNIDHPDGLTFEAGKSHQVRMTVYGPNEIQITTTLEEWESAESIDITFD